MNQTYITAAARLILHLDLLNIPYSLDSTESLGFDEDGWKLTFPWYAGDLICHECSYGGKLGLWESYGMPGDGNDVTGYLDTAAALAKILTAWAKRKG